MVYESYPWKQDLLRRKRLFLKYNTVEQFEKNEDAAYTALEKAVFYSAFIIRKLIDCRGKLSDDADKYALPVEKYAPRKEVNALNRWPDEDTHDWGQPNREAAQGKDVCNWLIHSYMFFFKFNKENTISGFFITSDYDRNKSLYYISTTDWLEYMTFVANDSVVASDMHYDKRVRDYIYTKKERGMLL